MTSIQDFSPEKFTQQYSRKLHNAIRRGLYKAAPNVIQEYREDGLEGTKAERKKKAVFKVRKNNTLAFIDSGFDARAREYGATIRAKSGYLKIVVDPDHRENLHRASAKGRDNGLFTKKYGSDLLLMERDGDKAKLVAVLKKKVVRKAIHPNDRLSAIAKRNEPHIRAAIEQQLDNIGD